MALRSPLSRADREFIRRAERNLAQGLPVRDTGRLSRVRRILAASSPADVRGLERGPRARLAKRQARTGDQALLESLARLKAIAKHRRTTATRDRRRERAKAERKRKRKRKRPYTPSEIAKRLANGWATWFAPFEAEPAIITWSRKATQKRRGAARALATIAEDPDFAAPYPIDGTDAPLWEYPDIWIANLRIKIVIADTETDEVVDVRWRSLSAMTRSGNNLTFDSLRALFKVRPSDQARATYTKGVMAVVSQVSPR